MDDIADCLECPAGMYCESKSASTLATAEMFIFIGTKLFDFLQIDIF